MAHALPLTKLVGLFVKTLSKPLSKNIKHQCMKYESTRNMLIGVGQGYHNVSSRLAIWSAGFKVRNIQKIDEDAALKEGSELLGESIVFLISGGVIVFEYNRSNESAKKKEDMKRAQAKAERKALQIQLQGLDARLQALEDQLKKKRDELDTKKDNQRFNNKDPVVNQDQDNGEVQKKGWWSWLSGR